MRVQGPGRVIYQGRAIWEAETKIKRGDRAQAPLGDGGLELRGGGSD